MKLIINQLCDERQQNLTISEYNYSPRCFYLKLIHMVVSKAKLKERACLYDFTQ